MFVSKPRAYLSEEPFSSYTLVAGSWPYPQTFAQAENACQGQTYLSEAPFRCSTLGQA